MHKYSSSAWVNLCVTVTNGLSPELGQGSGEWMNIAGTVGGLATGYGPLNMDGPCICDGMHGVLCHHSPRRISLKFGQHPLYSVSDSYICATTLYGPCYSSLPSPTLLTSAFCLPLR